MDKTYFGTPLVVPVLVRSEQIIVCSLTHTFVVAKLT